MGENILGGVLAGVISRSLFHPFDTLRARSQTVSVNYQPKTFFQNLVNTIKNQGVKSLYRGFTLSTIISGPATAIYLTGYDYFKELISTKSSFNHDSSITHLLSAMGAEAVSGVFWTPMEVIKQRLQIKKKSQKQILVEIWKSSGFLGYFKGYFINLTVFGPYTMIYWVIYEQLKLYFNKSHKQPYDPPLYVFLGCSCVSSVVAAGVTCPVDVIKTRIQTQEKGSMYFYDGMRDAIKKMWETEGMKGFWKGLVPRMWSIAPTTTVSISMFEMFKQITQTKT